MLRRLLGKGQEVVTLSRSAEPLSPLAAHHRVDLLTADPRTLRRIFADAGGGRLIHTAWYTDHADYLVADVNRDWLAASRRLFAAFRDAGGERMLGLGTCIEYAPGSGRAVEGLTPLGPDTLYGRCKMALSDDLLAMADAVWARVFFVYGPGDRAGRLVPHLIDRARAGLPITVNYGGLRRDYIHIDDLAIQIAALAESGLTGAVNTGTGRAVSLADIATATATAAGRPELADCIDQLDPAQAPLIEADMARSRAAIGPMPVRSLADGLLPLVRAF